MELLQPLAVALIPAAGSFLGGLAAEVRHVSDRMLSKAFHAAAGIVLAVVGIELEPDAIESSIP